MTKSNNDLKLELQEIIETIHAIRYNYAYNPRFRLYNFGEEAVTYNGLTALDNMLAPLKRRAALLEMELTG